MTFASIGLSPRPRSTGQLQTKTSVVRPARDFLNVHLAAGKQQAVGLTSVQGISSKHHSITGQQKDLKRAFFWSETFSNKRETVIEQEDQTR